ncbi:MAG: Ig-like protein [Armatimonadetes bacterium]|nr:Ig-like protein [Armatimonadota bacterium]
MRVIGSPLFVSCLLLGSAASAAPGVSKPAMRPRPGPALKSISVVPANVTLVGSRARQGVVVTGNYADGSVKDLTTAAKYSVSSPRTINLTLAPGSGPLLRPAGNGQGTVTATVPGAAPVTIQVTVERAGEAPPVSFKDEVVPALTKLGCSAGTCHGTPTGKGGLRLSLQGYAPELDYHALVREGGSRRVNPADPGRSLLLLKPLVELAHAGGKRLDPSMPEYQVLTRWISEGARDDREGAPTLTDVSLLPAPRTLMTPNAKQRVVAMAKFSDGSVRDVTHLAKLSTSDEDLATISREGLVEASGRGDIAVLVRYQDALKSLRLTFLKRVPGFQWTSPAENNYIDRHVFDRLKLFQIPASATSGDSEFLRRAYLDTVGLLPTSAEVRTFLADPSPVKRRKLIEDLTQRPEFADNMAVKWADVLRIASETMGDDGAAAYHKWLRNGFAANRPVSEMVREILTAKGSTAASPAANYFRAPRDSEGKVPPQALAESTAQLFLGVRMLCAKCHNHPFERWTQDEYYQFAAFFGQVRRRGGGGRPPTDEVVYLDPRGEVEHLRTGKVMQPKLLGGSFVGTEKGEDRRVALAEWLTSKDNPFFAKAVVNRIWAHLLGRGIVEPIDDFRDSNPAVNDALLDALAKDFAEHQFDLRYLVRTIMSSRTYQLTARTLPLNKEDATYFSHALPRLLTAEQLADVISQITGVPFEYEGYPKGTRATQLAGTSVKTGFLQVFGRPARNLNCECEREKDATLFQALKLITDRDIDQKLKDDSGRLAQLAASKRPEAEVLDELYLSALTRKPTDRERAEWTSYFSRTGDRRKAMEDLGWVLINSKEFLFRH